ncbi:acetylglutamate kinase [Thalassotalea sp. PP2-459]|uniref:acetylglutamate kinase n=1 Tax=Thalassotalea sp. PP2-459 TaxID=1742724 RepID=UPI0009442A53|nr:acetylglutamate kinase [Thalassotalea sp. PP2-459]OKY26856.1 acetylglutamate kinase [Thalassotalea sp. PP2-459]
MVITKKPLVIKIGGAILENGSALHALLNVITTLNNQPVVLVHGGGCVVDEMLTQAGFTTEKKHGLRVTPTAQMPLIAGALAGTVNKTIVSQANSLGLTAVGLSLQDGNMVSCDLHELGLGQVGVPKALSSTLLDILLKHHFLPIISSIGALSNGDLVNVNADDAAVVICQLLNAELLLLTDVDGVKDASGQYLNSLNNTLAKQLVEQGVIAGGMTAKVNAALYAAKQLRRSIAVASWKKPEQIAKLLNGEQIGTRIEAN